MDIEKLKPVKPKEPEPFKRRVWVSVVLTLLGMGPPLIYCGNLKAGIFLELIYIFLTFAVYSLVKFLPTATTLFFVLLLDLIIFIAFLIFIVKYTKGVNRENKPRLKDVWTLIIFVFLIFLGADFYSDYLSDKYLIESYSIPSTTMEETILAGDYLMASKGIDTDDLQRGDIIIFKYPKDPEQKYIKRLIAKAGNRIRIENKQVYLNGVKLDELYVQHIDSRNYPYTAKQNEWGIHIRDNMPEITIPDRMLFVLGDNRDNSSDSRFWGFVDEELVKGKARFIHFSWDSENNRVRWERIGMRLDMPSITDSE